MGHRDAEKAPQRRPSHLRSDYRDTLSDLIPSSALIWGKPHCALGNCFALLNRLPALAKRRGSPMEVGELDRIVIAFMQELEHAQGEGLVIATSNIPKALDDALWRRFDLRVTFPRPNAEALLRFAERRCHDFGLTPATRTLADCRKSGSYAVAEQVVISEARRRLLAR